MAARKKAAKKQPAKRKRPARKKAAKKQPAKRKRPAVVRSPVKEKPNAKVGRPSSYTPELGQEICDAISDGTSMSRACRENDHFPYPQTVRRWQLGIGTTDEERAEFCVNYEKARVAQADAMFDAVIDIPDAAEHRDGAGVSAAKNRSDARKWVLARMNRAKYGDQSNLQIGGDPTGVPVQQQVTDLTHMSREDLAALRVLGRKAIQGGE